VDRARTGQPDAARWNAFALQTCWDQLVEADRAADPRTGGGHTRRPCWSVSVRPGAARSPADWRGLWRWARPAAAGFCDVPACLPVVAG